MAEIDLVTREDLEQLRIKLIEDIKQIFKPTVEQQKKWLKSYEVRKILNISPGTLQNLRVNGTLPFTKIGGILYYDTEDINRLLKKNGSK